MSVLEYFEKRMRDKARGAQDADAGTPLLHPWVREGGTMAHAAEPSPLDQMRALENAAKALESLIEKLGRLETSLGRLGDKLGKVATSLDKTVQALDRAAGVQDLGAKR